MSAARSSRARAGGGIGAETLGGAHSPAAGSGARAAPGQGAGRLGTLRRRDSGGGAWAGPQRQPAVGSEHKLRPRGGGARGPRRPAQTALGGWQAHTQRLQLSPNSQRPQAGLLGVQRPRSLVVTYLQSSFPLAGSEVSVAAKRVCSARNRPRALPPLPGPLAGAPPGGRTLLPPYLSPSLFLPLLPSFLLSRHCLRVSWSLGYLAPLVHAYQQAPQLSLPFIVWCASWAPSLC